jgi:hypothetical protein
VLNIPTPDARALPHHAQPSAAEHATATLTDPFEGLPFAALAERFGGQVLPALQAAREEKRRGTRESRAAAAAAAAAPPPVPHFLPFTRWAAHNESFRATFVDVDDPKLRKKARLSWYHPDDTVSRRAAGRQRACRRGGGRECAAASRASPLTALRPFARRAFFADGAPRLVPGRPAGRPQVLFALWPLCKRRPGPRARAVSAGARRQTNPHAP